MFYSRLLSPPKQLPLFRLLMGASLFKCVLNVTALVYLSLVLESKNRCRFDKAHSSDIDGLINLTIANMGNHALALCFLIHLQYQAKTRTIQDVLANDDQNQSPSTFTENRLSLLKIGTAGECLSLVAQASALYASFSAKNDARQSCSNAPGFAISSLSIALFIQALLSVIYANLGDAREWINTGIAYCRYSSIWTCGQAAPSDPGDAYRAATTHATNDYFTDNEHDLTGSDSEPNDDNHETIPALTEEGSPTQSFAI